jgi:uncharacterized protein (UPF0179 family)
MKGETQMDWKERMLVGMKLISEACASNDSWKACKECPFDMLCTDLNDGRRNRWQDFESTADIFNEEIKKYERKEK